MNPRTILAGNIAILTLATAIIHAVVGYQETDTLLLINAAGYILLFSLFILPLFKSKRRYISIALFIYTFITFAGYFLMHPNPASAHGEANAAELVVTEEGDSEAVMTNDGIEITEFELEEDGGEYAAISFPVGPVTKGIEGVLMLLLLIDLTLRRSEKKPDSL